MVAAVKRQADSGASRTDPQASLLVQAIRAGNLEAIQRLIAEGASVNAATAFGTTPLMKAAALGKLSVVQSLLQHGATLNVVRSDGFAALTFAVFFGHQDVVSELIARGADIHVQSRNRTSLERWAAARGWFDILDLLQPAQHTPSVNVPLIELREPAPVTSPSSRPLKIVETNEIPNSLPITQQEREHPVDAWNFLDVDPGEGIRRLSPGQSVPIVLERPVQSTAPFSPVSALFDRLTWTWEHGAVIVLAVIVVFGALTFAALKALRSRNHTSVNSPAAAEGVKAATVQPSSGVQNQPPSTSTAPPVGSMNPQQTSATSPPGVSAEQHVPVAITSQPVEPQSQLTLEAEQTDTNARVPRGMAQHSTFAARALRKSKRGEKAFTVVDSNSNTTEDAGQPAAVTFVSKPPAPQPQQVSPPNNVRVQPTSPLEGSSTKRRVIQWP